MTAWSDHRPGFLAIRHVHAPPAFFRNKLSVSGLKSGDNSARKDGDCGYMGDYENEKWVELYRSALLELEHAKMAGRIGDARFEIAARIEKLSTLPDLHTGERQALSDALSSLRTLEREDAQHAESERRVAEAALAGLRMIGPRIESL
jgi:hypothetical protein